MQGLLSIATLRLISLNFETEKHITIQVATAEHYLDASSILLKLMKVVVVVCQLYWQPWCPWISRARLIWNLNVWHNSLQTLCSTKIQIRAEKVVPYVYAGKLREMVIFWLAAGADRGATLDLQVSEIGSSIWCFDETKIVDKYFFLVEGCRSAEVGV